MINQNLLVGLLKRGNLLLFQAGGRNFAEKSLSVPFCKTPICAAQSKLLVSGCLVVSSKSLVCDGNGNCVRVFVELL